MCKSVYLLLKVPKTQICIVKIAIIILCTSSLGVFASATSISSPVRIVFAVVLNQMRVMMAVKQLVCYEESRQEGQGQMLTLSARYGC